MAYRVRCVKGVGGGAAPEPLPGWPLARADSARRVGVAVTRKARAVRPDPTWTWGRKLGCINLMHTALW